jgi:hypothetical protein
VRTMLGVLVGAVAGVAAILAIALVGHFIFPISADVNLADRQAVGALIEGLPLGAQAFTVASWFGGALAGGLVAGLIARSRPAAWTAGAIVALVSILNILMVPHPEWMQVAAVIAPALGALIAGHVVAGRRRVADG